MSIRAKLRERRLRRRQTTFVYCPMCKTEDVLERSPSRPGGQRVGELPMLGMWDLLDVGLRHTRPDPHGSRSLVERTIWG
jgi:hypothetical protein